MKKKILICCLCALAAISGCSSGEDNDTQKKISLKTEEPAKIIEKETEPTEKIIEEEPKEMVFANLEEEFVPLNETVTESPFSDIEEFWDLKAASGEAVLYDDVVCPIYVEYDGYNLTISVEEDSTSIYAEALCDIKVVDLDEDDEFYEIAVSSEGASADPSVSFIRYDGEELIPLYFDNIDYSEGSIYGDLEADEEDVYPTYGAIWTNKKGMLITSFQNIGFISPRLALSYFELEDNVWVEKDFEEPVVAGKHKISHDFSGFFTKMDEAPQDYDDSAFIFGMPYDEMTTFESGEEIEILEYGRLYNYYSFYAEYNGEKGVLAFFLGD